MQARQCPSLESLSAVSDLVAEAQRLAARCEVTTDDHDDEAERRASQDTVELMAALRKQRPCVSKLQR